jgi:hypothetical protein
MPSRSIRSFALDYYRKRGAEIRQLAGDEAFEICESTGTSLTVTFAQDPDAPTHATVNATSPQWRAILEDLTADVAVSYRYLVTGPIARPAETLQAKLPEGWAIRSARLLHVENRIAIGFSHRVTFDSPALNACTEQIHHHLWDVAAERRLTAIEPRLYELPCILIRPEHFPDEAIVQGLLGRTLAAVDEASDAYGREIERELALMLAETEKRTNQYFDQQLGNVLQREVTLTEKLDGTIKRLTEARTPENVARLRQDGESLARQLEHMKANREREMASVEAACLTKLTTERERHELTATTDLAAICHASYDVLTYKAEVVTPDGLAVSWELRYCPIASELTCPPCLRCNLPMEQPEALKDGGFACAACAARCEGCGSAYATSEALAACASCQRGACAGCAATCIHCGDTACLDHLQGCGTCEAPACVRCLSHCAECDMALCQNHARLDAQNGQTVCEAHFVAVVAALEAEVAAVRLAPAALPPAMAWARLSAATSAPAATVEEQAPIEVESVAVIPAAKAPFVAFAPAVTALAAAVLGASPCTNEWPSLGEVLANAAQDTGVEHLFPRPQPVYSGLSGRAIHPKMAETCPACEGHFAVQEMVDCPTCLTPTCLGCAQGPHGPCPACDALEPVDNDDDRLAFVFAQFPKLARGRRWEIASMGPYVLAHWSRLGTWGMVVYHLGAEPVVLTSFSFGRLETFKQVLGGLQGASA